MLVTPYRPQATRLTAGGEKLLQMIRDAGEVGTTRPELAKALGKKRLNMWHEAQLQLLLDQGAITVSQRPNARLNHVLEYVYRLAGKE